MKRQNDVLFLRAVINRPRLTARCHLKTGGNCETLRWVRSHDQGQTRATGVPLELSGKEHLSSRLLRRSCDAHKAYCCPDQKVHRYHRHPDFRDIN
ncbi:uncharacterized [Tachysurus ichikawai]